VNSLRKLTELPLDVKQYSENILEKVLGSVGETSGGWIIYPVMLGIGFIGGLHQVGIGFFMIAALRHLMNMDLVRINMHKAAVFFIYTIPAMVVFGLGRPLYCCHSRIIRFISSGNISSCLFGRRRQS